MVEQQGGGALGFVLPAGGGFIFNTDGTFEAAHGYVTEIKYNWKRGEVRTSLIVPPPTDETIVVCSRWLKAKGRDGAPPPADAADAAAEEADAA